MRLSAQNNQFIFSLPYYLMEVDMESQFNKLMVKNFIPYGSVMDYINAQIKEIVVPSITFNPVEQTVYHGKKLAHKESGNIYDKFANEVQVTFRAVDSYLNYFMLLQMMTEFYLNNAKPTIDFLYIEILDMDGDKLYTVMFKDCFFKGLSEISLGYNKFDISEKTFTVSIRYNWIDIRWELDDEDTKTSKSIFDIPINFKPDLLDRN